MTVDVGREIASWVFLAQWVYWLVAAVTTRRQAPEAGPKAGSWWYPIHILVLAASIFACVSNLHGWGGPLLFPPTAWGFPLVLLGVGVSAWSRVHLGRCWSGAIVLREGHRVVQSGPYRFVRHPIYIGIACSLAGFFLMHPVLAAAVGMVAGTATMTFKALHEEKFLLHHFGQEYADYMSRSGRLLPSLSIRGPRSAR